MIFLTACQSEKEKLVGHWHVGNDEYIYHAFDITDSLTMVREPYALTFKENELYYIDYTSDTYKVVMQGDLMVVPQNGFFAKKHTNCNLEKDYFSNLFVNIDLPEVNESEAIDTAKYDIKYLYIGKPKPSFSRNVESRQFNTSKVKEDTVVVQVNDVIITEKEISLLEDGHRQYDAPPIIPLLNIDKKISVKALHDIVNQVEILSSKPYFSVACITSGKPIGSRAIRVDIYKFLADSAADTFANMTIQQYLQQYVQRPLREKILVPDITD